MFEPIMAKNLRKIMATEKPYRKRPNEYPYDVRAYGHKYFKAVLGDNGEPTAYHFYYYGLKLFIIYSNDVIEFCMDSYGQGETCIINNMCGGFYIRHEGARGGSLLSKSAYNYPMIRTQSDKPPIEEHYVVRKGMKYNMRTDKPVKGHEYEIHTHVVDSKKGAEVRKKNKDLLTLINIWLQNVTYKECIDLQVEIQRDINDVRMKYKDSHNWLESTAPMEYAMTSWVIARDRLSVPYNKQKSDMIAKANQESIKDCVRQRLYDVGKAHKTNVISWKEKKIPTNKKLEVKWLTKNWKSV